MHEHTEIDQYKNSYSEGGLDNGSNFHQNFGKGANCINNKTEGKN